MLPRLNPADAQRLPFYRLAAIALSWLFPVVTLLFLPGTLDHPVRALLGALFYPTVRKAILLAGIAVQVLRLVRPDQDRPKTFVFTQAQGELGVLFLALMLDFSLVFMNRTPGIVSDIVRALDWAAVLWIFSFRGRVVIDGVARTITTGEPFARTLSFDAVRGLGMIETRLMRRGAHVSTTYQLALFPQEGKPTPIFGYSTPQDVDITIAQLVQETGIPIARG
jgi:hypothetical protein